MQGRHFLRDEAKQAQKETKTNTVASRVTKWICAQIYDSWVITNYDLECGGYDAIV
jgi:hypothetical protein